MPFSFPNKKSPRSPMGTRTETIISAVPPCLPENPTASARCQHTVCPLTLAMRQKILWKNHFPLPSAAHLLPRLSLRSQLCGTLCGCALQLYSRVNGFLLCYECYTPRVSICQALFFTVCGQAVKATPHNGARRFGARFLLKRKHEKCGNTGCISHFSYCTIGAKDPPKPAAPT